jgi:hypothetical protein
MAHEWRNHPKLRGRLHREYPDDVQVIVHDGGPRMTDRRPEAVWVRVVAADGDVFTGELLNAPQQLASVKQGERVQFIVPESGPHPVMVRPKYLAERADWVVRPCDRCGMSELFDAPSDLIAKVFPRLPAGSTMRSFTAFCGVCGGTQVVSHAKFNEDDAGGDAEPKRGAIVLADRPRPAGKKWWQFWR